MYIILALNSQSSICLWSAQRFVFLFELIDAFEET